MGRGPGRRVSLSLSFALAPLPPLRCGHSAADNFMPGHNNCMPGRDSFMPGRGSFMPGHENPLSTAGRVRGAGPGHPLSPVIWKAVQPRHRRRFMAFALRAAQPKGRGIHCPRPTVVPTGRGISPDWTGHVPRLDGACPQPTGRGMSPDWTGHVPRLDGACPQTGRGMSPGMSPADCREQILVSWRESVVSA